MQVFYFLSGRRSRIISRRGKSFLRQLLHLFPLFLKAVVAAPFAQFKEGEFFGGVVHNHQGTLFGEAVHFEREGFFGDGPVHQQAVVDVDGGGISGEAFGEGDGVGFDEVTVFTLFLLQPHAHIDEDDDHEDDGKGENAVADHELFVGVQAVCHREMFFKICCKCNELI